MNPNCNGGSTGLGTDADSDSRCRRAQVTGASSRTRRPRRLLVRPVARSRCFPAFLLLRRPPAPAAPSLASATARTVARRSTSTRSSWPRPARAPSRLTTSSTTSVVARVISNNAGADHACALDHDRSCPPVHLLHERHDRGHDALQAQHGEQALASSARRRDRRFQRVDHHDRHDGSAQGVRSDDRHEPDQDDQRHHDHRVRHRCVRCRGNTANNTFCIDIASGNATFGASPSLSVTGSAVSRPTCCRRSVAAGPDPTSERRPRPRRPSTRVSITIFNNPANVLSSLTLNNLVLNISAATVGSVRAILTDCGDPFGPGGSLPGTNADTARRAVRSRRGAVPAATDAFGGALALLVRLRATRSRSPVPR